jgi:cation transport ATPase
VAAFRRAFILKPRRCATRTRRRDDASPEQLLGAVEAAGTRPAALERLGSSGNGDPDNAEAAELAPLRTRMLVSAPLALIAFVISMVPALQFDFWQWAVLQLTTPVILWSACRFTAPLGQPQARHRHDGHARVARQASLARQARDQLARDRTQRGLDRHSSKSARPR